MRYDNPKSIAAYRHVLAPLKADFGPCLPLSSITPENIDDCNKALRSRIPPLSPWTLDTRRKRLKAFFNWCTERGYIAQSPARFLKVNTPRTKAGNKAIAYEVLMAMFDEARQKPDFFTRTRDSALLGLIITFGARVGDVAHLVQSYVNEDWIVLDVKGGAENRLPLPPNTRALLYAWLDIRRTLDPYPAHNFVFTNNRLTLGTRYGPLTVGGLRRSSGGCPKTSAARPTARTRYATGAASRWPMAGSRRP